MKSRRTEVMIFWALLLAGAALAISLAPAFSALVQGADESTPVDVVPNVFNYRGVLRDSDGNLAANGEYDLTFRIYDALTGGNELYKQTHTGVIVRDGAFSVSLTDIPDQVFTDGVDRFIGVTVEPYQEMVPRQRLASVPYAVQAQHAELARNSLDSVPVGAIVDFWWPSGMAYELPAGWLPCDGRVVNDPESPFNGKQLPDLRDQFVRGAPTSAQILDTGGSVSHTHQVSIPDHTHSIDHDHAAFGVNTTVTDGLEERRGGAGATYTQATYDHTHSVWVDVPAYSGDSGAAGGGTFDSTSAENLPPYTYLLKICRVK